MFAGYDAKKKKKNPNPRFPSEHRRDNVAELMSIKISFKMGQWAVILCFPFRHCRQFVLQWNQTFMKVFQESTEQQVSDVL